MSLRVVKARESAGGLDQAFSRIRVTGGESDAREPLLKIISHAYDVRSWSSARHAGNRIDQYDFDKTGRPTSCQRRGTKDPTLLQSPIFPGCAHVSRGRALLDCLQYKKDFVSQEDGRCESIERRSGPKARALDSRLLKGKTKLEPFDISASSML